MKLKYYVLGLVSACAFTSCNDDFLERAPKDQLSDTSYWQSKDDAEKFRHALRQKAKADGHYCDHRPSLQSEL